VISAQRRERRRPASLPGAGLFLLLALVTAGCSDSPEAGPDQEVLGARALGLADGARLHRVILGGRGSDEHVLPARIRASRGDGVEFVTVDHRVHTVWFPPDSLAAEALAFLISTEQEESPPLLRRGSRFVLVLEWILATARESQFLESPGDVLRDATNEVNPGWTDSVQTHIRRLESFLDNMEERRPEHMRDLEFELAVGFFLPG